MLLTKVDHEAISAPYWWACEYPERPWEAYTVAHRRCRACLIAGRAAAPAWGMTYADIRTADGTLEKRGRFVDMLRLAESEIA